MNQRTDPTQGAAAGEPDRRSETLPSIELGDLDLAAMTEVENPDPTVRRARLAGGGAPRKVFTDGTRYYKVWPPGWPDFAVVMRAGSLTFTGVAGLDGRDRLAGHAFGLYDDDVCPAFAANIYDGGRLVGYVTLAGTPLHAKELDGADAARFVDRVIAKTVVSGHVLRDLKHGNLIRLPDGRISLIDLETPLAQLAGLDLGVEAESGALRRGRSRRYRKFILDFFDRRCTDPAILAARMAVESAGRVAAE